MPNTTQLEAAPVAATVLEDVTGGCHHCCRPHFAPSFSFTQNVQIGGPAPEAPPVAREFSTTTTVQYGRGGW